MNTTLLILLPGLLVGLGVAMLVLLYAPRTVRADAALARLGETPIAVTANAAPTSRWERIGSWIAQHAPQVKFFMPPTRDLDLLEIPVAQFYARKAQLALLGIAAIAVAPVLVPLVTGQAFLLPLIMMPVVALVLWVVPDSQVAAKARAARREFTRFVGVYLQLVAVALLGNVTADAALRDAASVSDGWVFQRIRREYAAAELTRTSKWEALERLGEELELPALSELGRTMRLSEARVGLRDQLLASSVKLRRIVGGDDRAAAERVTKAIELPVFLTLIPILAIVMIPPFLQLLNL